MDKKISDKMNFPLKTKKPVPRSKTRRGFGANRKGNRFHCGTDLLAPFGADVSTMGGDILIKSAGEYIVAQTMGGDIDVRKLDGGIDASTMGGDIDVVMVGDPDEGNRDVEISSKGGEIHLTVPDGLSMEFDLKIEVTRRKGDYAIQCDFPINIEGENDEDTSWSSRRNYIYGTGSVDGGKNKIKIDTVNGDIYIHKGK